MPDSVQTYLLILAIVGGSIALFTAIRIVVLWYFKINKRVYLLEDILAQSKKDK